MKAQFKSAARPGDGLTLRAEALAALAQEGERPGTLVALVWENQRGKWVMAGPARVPE